MREPHCDWSHLLVKQPLELRIDVECNGGKHLPAADPAACYVVNGEQRGVEDALVAFSEYDSLSLS